MNLKVKEVFRFAGAIFYGQISFYARNNDRKTVSSAYYFKREAAEKWLRESIDNIEAPIDEANIIEKWVSFPCDSPEIEP